MATKKTTTSQEDAVFESGLDEVTNLLYSGADPKTVQYLAGHKNSKITMDTYAKVKYNRPEQLLPVVDRAFSSEKGSESTTQTLE